MFGVATYGGYEDPPWGLSRDITLGGGGYIVQFACTLGFRYLSTLTWVDNWFIVYVVVIEWVCVHEG